MHFGERDAPLYGVLHSGAEPRRRRGVLVLGPWGWEALRAHRTLQLLATRLAHAGYDAFRFDYSCSGDSAGDQRNVSADRWMEDATYALEELRAVAGVARVGVVGLRLGGLFAVNLAARRPRDIDRLVLWEPARSGTEFVEWMSQVSNTDMGAFPLTPRFQKEVVALDNARLTDFAGSLLHISRRPLGAGESTPRKLRELSSPIDDPPCWVEDRHHGAGAVPVPVISGILDWFNE